LGLIALIVISLLIGKTLITAGLCRVISMPLSTSIRTGLGNAGQKICRYIMEMLTGFMFSTLLEPREQKQLLSLSTGKFCKSDSYRAVRKLP